MRIAAALPLLQTYTKEGVNFMPIKGSVLCIRSRRLLARASHLPTAPKSHARGGRDARAPEGVYPLDKSKRSATSAEGGPSYLKRVQ